MADFLSRLAEKEDESRLKTTLELTALIGLQKNDDELKMLLEHPKENSKFNLVELVLSLK